MLVELHIIQNFAPSNLNRDDTGAPKDCTFGGVRRARISSQCIKRSIRKAFEKQDLLSGDFLAKRTRLLLQDLTERLVDKKKDADEAKVVITAALAGGGLGVDKDGTSEYLLFLGEGELRSLADLCLEHWDVLLASAAPPAAEGDKRSKKDQKKDKKQAVPEEIQKKVKALLDGGKAADLALFGRMLADMPEKNMDPGCQVAHAISTHKVSMEFDYYTAVDDLKPKEESGAGMLGTVEFNSACFYRYSNLDIQQLLINLQGDRSLAEKAVEAYLKAAVSAIPTGKQNTFAAFNPPDFVLAVVREKGQPLSLTNAFEKAVSPAREGGYVARSVQALDEYWGKLAAVYGAEGIQLHLMRVGGEPALKAIQAPPQPMGAFIDGVVKGAFAGRKG